MSISIGPEHLEAFRTDLLAWYDAEKRDLPWRQTSDPYRIWLSEVMLQQTRVDQATPYYRRFIERFPTVETLAGSDLDDVLLCWEGLGYYSRARNLHQAARRVVEKFDGRVPDEEHDIKTLPGVGDYTAAAVLSIAYNKPHAVVDGNVVRVISRVFAFGDDVNTASSKRALSSAAGALLDLERPGAFNQALMELGATLCSPSSPSCAACPLQQVCAASKARNPESYPVSAKRGRVPHHDISVAVVFDQDGKVLIQRRAEDAMLGGLWEFPGGKREEEETLEEACIRELREELGVEVVLGERFCRISHAYSHFRITLHAFRARIQSGDVKSNQGLPVRWVYLRELSGFAFPRANRKLIDILSHLPEQPTLF